MSPKELERKVRQHDNDLRSVYEMLSSIQAAQKQYGNRLGELTEMVEDKFAAQDARFDTVQGQLAAQDARFDTVQSQLAAHDTRFDTVQSQLAAHDTRFDTVQSQLAAHDTRFDTVDRKLDNVLELLQGRRPGG